MIRSRRWWLLLPAGAVVAGAALLISIWESQSCGSSGAGVGCATAQLKPPAGTSVVAGYGRLTGRTADLDGTVLHQFRIDRADVLVGDSRTSTFTGWLATVPDPGPGLAAAQVPGVWAPNGHVLAFVRARSESISDAPTMSVRPIVGHDVIFSADDCGSAPASLATVPFTGDLAEVPGSRSLTVARCYGGFHAASRSDVERLIR